MGYAKSMPCWNGSRCGWHTRLGPLSSLYRSCPVWRHVILGIELPEMLGGCLSGEILPRQLRYALQLRFRDRKPDVFARDLEGCEGHRAPLLAKPRNPPCSRRT
jgi:hypothetical protein